MSLRGRLSAEGEGRCVTSRVIRVVAGTFKDHCLSAGRFLEPRSPPGEDVTTIFNGKFACQALQV